MENEYKKVLDFLFKSARQNISLIVDMNHTNRL